MNVVPNAVRLKPAKPIITIALGIVLMVAVLYSHGLARVQRELAAGQRAGWACGGEGWIDCSRTLVSKYSVVQGVPVSAYATAWSAFMLTLLVAGVAHRSKRALLHRALFFASLPAVGVAIFYAVISVFIIKAICLYCLGQYLLVALIVWLCFAGMEKGGAKGWNGAVAAVWMPLGWTMSVAVFIGVLAWNRSVAPSPSKLVASPVPVAVTREAAGQRAASKPILRIIEFSDFECPPCQYSARQLLPFEARYPTEVEVLVVDLPFHHISVLESGAPVPLSAYLASALGVVMQNRGRFWDYYRAMFMSEQTLSEAVLWEVTEKLLGKREMDAVRREVESPDILAGVKRNIAVAKANGINQTPTWIINGERFVGALTDTQLEARLAAARRAQMAVGPPVAP